ncbi:MAG: ATP-binding cassette domain-containing protein [Terriglobales bacterium]
METRSMAAAYAVEVEGIGHCYGDLRALAGVSFTVAEGEIFGVLGPNGGGKSTLFRILSTVMRVQEGTARVGGFDLRREPDMVRRCLGVVFQASSLDLKLTVEENLRHQGHLYGLRGRDLGRRVDLLLGRVGMADRRGTPCERLSGGQRRRIEIAKGLLHRPQLLLLDEPTMGLDPLARREMWSYLTLLRERDGIAVLTTTHLLEEAEDCDRLAILHKGHLAALGTPADLKREIEGEVLVMEAEAPERLRQSIQERWHQPAQVIGRQVRIERARAHEFVPALMEAFGPQIRSVTVARPTLEDVFLRRTGQRWSIEATGEAAEEASAGALTQATT